MKSLKINFIIGHGVKSKHTENQPNKLYVILAHENQFLFYFVLPELDFP